MDPAVASIIVAVIGTVGSLIGVAVKEFRALRRENRADHGVVMLKLNKVQKTVEKVSDRLDDHIDWHLEKK
jgi:hypothetical protein